MMREAYMGSWASTRISMLAAAIGVLHVLGCDLRGTELPPVKTPVRVRLACQPPQRSLFPVPPAELPIGSSCGLRSLECDEVRPLVVEIDERGNPTAAYIPGMRSSQLDACILNEIRDAGWAFEPARECSGEPLAGEYVTEQSIVC